MRSPPRISGAPVLASLARAEPFHSAEEAWFWTMSALLARREGARVRAGQGLSQRPCEPDDVVKCLDRLYRQRRIDLTHARVLRVWGERGVPPSPRQPGERDDHRLWQEAMQRLESPLRVKGILSDSATATDVGAQILPFRTRPA